MSIATALTNARNKIAACYTAISGKGGTLPATQDLINMPTAINSITTGSSITVEALTVTENGTTTAPSGKAYSPVTVNVSGGGAAFAKADLDANGAVVNVSSVDVSNIVTIGSSKLYAWQRSNYNLTGTLSFDKLESISSSGLNEAFYSCNLTSVSFPKLTTVEASGLYSAFALNSNLTSISFPELTTLSGYGSLGIFLNACRNITTVSFPKLVTLGTSSFAYAFSGCTNLTSIHFRSDMQSTIESYTDYGSKWGASNATIYFDL